MEFVPTFYNYKLSKISSAPLMIGENTNIGRPEIPNLLNLLNPLNQTSQTSQTSASITSHKKASANSGGFLVGLPGFEPRQTESKSVVLPLHNNPINIKIGMQK